MAEVGGTDRRAWIDRRSEPALNDGELRVVRTMIEEYQSDRAVDAWFSAKWKAGLLIVSGVGGVAVLTASLIQIAQAFH